MNIKKTNEQMPIPENWKAIFCTIVECLKNSDFIGIDHIDGVEKLSNKSIQQINDSIQDYGETLISLPNATWKRSVCSWQKNYWDVIIDLFTEEGESDLVLKVRVYEDNTFYRFCITGVYVP